MKKFIVIYRMPAAAMEQMKDKSPEDMKKGMEAWHAWAAKCGDGLVDLGAPLGKVHKVNQDGATEGSDDVGGYSILQAESMEAALEMLKDHPHNSYHESCEINVYEAMPLPGEGA